MNSLLSVFPKVYDSFLNKKEKHLYIVINNNKLETSENKKLSSSIQDIAQFIFTLKDNISDHDKSLLFKQFKLISDTYKTKHNGLWARIKRFFLCSYKEKYEQTIVLINVAQKELASPYLEKEFNQDLSQAKVLTKDDKVVLSKKGEKLAHFYEAIGNIKKATHVRMRLAEAIGLDGPLSDIPSRLEQEDPILGIKLSRVGGSAFKQQMLSVKKRTFTNGKSQLHIEGKLSHPKRQELQNTLDLITKNPEQFFACLPTGFCKKVIVTEEKTVFYGRTTKNEREYEGPFSDDASTNGYAVGGALDSLLGYLENKNAKIIHFKGIGKVKVGNDPKRKTLYNRIEIDLDSTISDKDAPEKLHLLFAALGLHEASCSSGKEDIERLKIMQLFRIFYPKEAYLFEREALTFEEPIDHLKARIIKMVPDMKDKFEKHLAEMYEQEVYPNYSIWAVKGFAQHVREKGGTTLMAGIITTDFTTALFRFGSMLKIGALSILDRFQLGIVAKGQSCGDDLASGGGDSVFVRMITQNASKKLNKYYLAGQMVVLYDLELLERGGYGYPIDRFGTKKSPSYENRSNILTMTEKYSEKPKEAFPRNNEFCIRNRVPPRFIKGAVVSDQSKKEQLIAFLKSEGLVSKNKEEQECVNGIPIDQFIHVGNCNFSIL